MTELILTEKYSVAADFAKALGIPRGKGCFRNSGTIVTWAVGHLVELCEPDAYDPSYKKWRMDNLPLIPATFIYRPIKKTMDQFMVIKSLLGEPGLERVIIATDAGREGEVIARTILMESGFKKKDILFRFWTSQALVPDVVRRGLGEIRPITHFDRLWRAGYYRQVADWLVGMNCTRMITLRLNGDLFSVGRVQTAVLAMIADRKRERETFVPETYWIVKILFSHEKGEWKGQWFKGKHTRITKKEERDALCEKLENHAEPGVVTSVKKERKSEPPPQLFSLTDLQQEANRRFGFSAQKTLNIAQGLYQDKKCLSYPRTDSKVLGTENLGMVEAIIKKLSQASPGLFMGIDPGKISLANKRVFNDAKLTDHHALIPFKPLAGGASRDEQLIFDLVVTRFAAAFHPDCRFENTHVVTTFASETFQTKGRVILVPGWRSIYGDISDSKKGNSSFKKDDQDEGEHIPPLARGDRADAVKIMPEERQTTPPPDYTDSLLLKDMTNPGRYVHGDDMKKLYRGDVGIGTQATRAQIIETLLKRGYIERTGKKLIATDKGSFLVDMIRKCPVTSVLTSPEETARWEMSLNRISLGEAGEGDTAFLSKIKEFVTKSINELKAANFAMKTFPTETPPSLVIGLCPACGGGVRETRKAFSCSGAGCDFVIWKKIAGKIISPAIASNLLKFKKTGPFKDFVSRKK
ncbi:MAG: DNA topoisomerase III, partial [Desulfamplus sp.]|nr:DNA topoisomerase III [Desulfamplus sp.]